MYLSQFLYNIFRLSYRARKWYLHYLYKYLTPEIVTVQMKDSTKLRIRPRYDYVQREIFLYQGEYKYEPNVVKWLSENVSERMTVVDIGSHIGYYLGPICHQVGPDGTAIFIEPLPEHFELLKNNIAGNRFTNAYPINKAISNQFGEVVLYPAKDSGRNSLAKNEITDGVPIHIPASTIDIVFQEHRLQRIDLLQIDVEGAEVLAFQGASECLKEEKIRVILCEWHPQQMLNDFHVDPMDLLNQLLGAGFSVTCLENKSSEEVSFSLMDARKYQHLIFRKF